MRTIFANSRPQILQSRMASADSVLIANNDILNPLYVGTSPNPSPNAGDVTQVPPLGAIAFGNRTDLYVVTSGPTVQAFVMPGATSWTPSPAQVAAQINALGLAKDTSVQGTTTAVGGTTAAVNAISGQFVSESLYNTGTVNLPGGVSPVFVNLSPLVPVSLTGVGLNGAAVDFFSSYEISLTCICSNGVGAASVYTVTMQWFNDVADTAPVDQITWSLPANTGAGVLVLGKGPMRGNFLSIIVSSNDANGTTPVSTIVVKLTGSLRDSPAGDDWRGNSVGLGSNASSAKAWTNMILYSVALNIPVGSVARDALLYSGPVTIYMENNSTNGILIASFAAQFAPNPVLWRGSVPQNTAGTTPTLINLKFPRAPVTLTVGNSGAAAGSLDVSVVADRV